MIWLNGYFKTPISANPVNQGSGDGGSYKIVKQTDTEVTIAPNTLNVWDEVETLNITLQAPTEGIVNEYLIQFTSGSTPTVLTLPKDVTWASKLEIQSNKIYLISIVNNLAAFLEFSISPSFVVLVENLQEDDGALMGIPTNNLNPLYDYIRINLDCSEEFKQRRDSLCEMSGLLLDVDCGTLFNENISIIIDQSDPIFIEGIGIYIYLQSCGLVGEGCVVVGMSKDNSIVIMIQMVPTEGNFISIAYLS